jgi:hypothetical protein
MFGLIANEDDGVFSAYLMKGEITLKGSQDGYHIVLFFKDTMFELQPYHYYENISKCFCMLWSVKTEKKINAEKITLFYFIRYDVRI